MDAGNESLPARVTAIAGAVLGAGLVAWVIPGRLWPVGAGFVVPAITLAALPLAVALSKPWRSMQAALAVMGVTLVVGWWQVQGLGPANSHFAGAGLGMLTLALTGRVCGGLRLRWAAYAFVAMGAVALAGGLLGVETTALGRLSTLVGHDIARVSLGLDGLGQAGVNANALAAAALLVSPMAIAVLTVDSGTAPVTWVFRALALGCVALAGIALVISLSRTAWLAVWLTLVILLMRGLRTRTARAWACAVLLAAPLVLLVVIYQTERQAFVNEAADLWDSLHDRGRVITAGAARLGASPLLGIGLSQYRSAVGPVSASAATGPASAGLTVEGDHVNPTPGEWIRLNIRVAAGAVGAPELRDGDWVRLVVAGERSGATLDSWGTVRDGTPPIDGVRTWTFRRGLGVNSGSAAAGLPVPGGTNVHHVGGEYYDVAHAHNLIVQTGLDLGIIGLLAYLILLGSLLRHGARKADQASGLSSRVAAGATIALLSITLFGLGDCVALGAKIGLFHWFAGGLILAVQPPGRVDAA